jgi:hypothetical protein
MTLTEISLRLAELTSDARDADRDAEELRLAAARAHERARVLKERSDSVQRRLAAGA